MRGIAFGRRWLLQTSALAGAAFAAPRWASAQSSTLKIRSIVDIQTLDPAFTYAVHEHNINRAMLHNLITWKKHLSWEWELDAATSVEQADATHINFALRDDLGWTNGFGAMTAEDVKFSFERIKDPELQSSYQADWALLDHVEITGERTGTIVMQQPFAPLWNSTLPWVSGFILCKKAIEVLPGKRVETEQPATSGPYKVTNWTPKQSLTLGRNDLFTGPKADFDEITFFPVDEDKTAELGFEAGEYDYTGISVSSVPRYRDALPEGAVLGEFPGWITTGSASMSSTPTSPTSACARRCSTRWTCRPSLRPRSSASSAGRPAIRRPAPLAIARKTKSARATWRRPRRC